jgi:hypothetical protein
MRYFLAAAALLSLFVPVGRLVMAAEPAPEDVTFFENRIRPVLVKHCYECHSKDSKELGGKLLLDSRKGLLMGGETGPSLVSGKPEESLLIQALRWQDIQMPPDEPLPETVINDFVKWIERGAADPRTGDVPQGQSGADEKEALWSLRPVTNPAVPDVQNQDWSRDPIDRFVLARIEAAGLTPADDADARTLVRRLYFDLTGLPPAFDDVEQFVAACERNRAIAVEQLVDSLLASPRFGERWGRHWLDVARYGESNGNDGLGRNPTFPHAWRYRDYVIAAFNSDMPFDRFVTEQIAGDLLPADSDEQHDQQLIATGFLAMASKPAKAMNSNFDMDVVADQIDVVGRGIMGLSVACARCHDHKFDPVPMREYYALAGIFTSTETMWGVAGHEKLTAPETSLHVLKAAPKVPPPADFVETVIVKDSATGIPKAIPKPKWPVGTPLAMGVRDREKPSDTKINVKGDSQKLGDVVPRGFVTACGLDGAVSIPEQQSGRVELAQWLTRADHPLTARVIVNRIWQHLFGEGIVATPDDFGVYGARPTHPQLLDHLATRFVRDGWSVKRLVRAIVLSRTWQLASTASDQLLEKDSANVLLTRHNRRRLDAEAIRDAMLSASGQLDLQPGDGSLIRHRDILVNLAGNLHEPSNKRSIYLCYLRSSPPPELAAFDLPEFTSVTGQRDLSTIPAQALHLFNSRFVIVQAQRLSEELLAVTSDDSERARLAFRSALGRDASAAEVAQALELVREATSELESADKAWASVAQALLATNEFRYVD